MQRSDRTAKRAAAVVLATVALACAGTPAVREERVEVTESRDTAARAPRGPVTISIVGTNDLHGRVERVPILAGYVNNLRRARERDGGGVLLVDGGDMFQGTLVSNLGEGGAVVRAYDAAGYGAVAVGNHEFDYGPIGAGSVPGAPGENPRGALLARAAEASFPFLVSNIRDQASGAPVEWPNVRPSVILDVAGVKVGVVGATTEDTATTTIAANVADLRFSPIAAAAREQAERLRAEGAQIVVLVAHAGGECEDVDDPGDLTTCDPDEEIFRTAAALPPGLVDVIVGGHTHAGVAHRVNGIAIIESFAYGRAFGRVDVTWDAAARRVTGVTIHPPRDLCTPANAPVEACAPGEYEGAPVAIDTTVRDAVAEDFARAREVHERPLGVTVAEEITRDYDGESPLGNLFSDLMREARPTADVTIVNGGGLRANLPAGELTYGEVYEAFPFDNRFATIVMTAEQLGDLLEISLGRDNGFLSVSGVQVDATCRRGELSVRLRRANGRPIAASAEIRVVTSDFLATGGDGFLTAEDRADVPVDVEDGAPIREALAERLEARRGRTIRVADVYDPRRPRVRYPGSRPVRCEPQGGAAATPAAAVPAAP